LHIVHDMFDNLIFLIEYEIYDTFIIK
jgi:hypothetical protein